ncbi:MAG: dTMP kinase [Planctomycetaceae bacterium]|nr:dTMP kinase [Planctomycetaceae bacterium]MCA9186420.1 dTMP kinase [Planctomycetales bacterium]
MPLSASLFFTFDGIDGTGKSTQARLFAEWLESRGHDVVQCRDPGSTELGEQIRSILLTHSSLTIGSRSETLLYMAARAQLVEEVIQPALSSGKAVVSDRFLLANVVYQAHAGGLDAPQVWQVGAFATSGMQPLRTYLLDLDVELAASRLKGDADRMERRGTKYFEAVRNGFLTEASQQPDRIAIIDARHSIDEIQLAIRQDAEKLGA